VRILVAGGAAAVVDAKQHGGETGIFSPTKTALGIATCFKSDNQNLPATMPKG
jgi:hypothetical protein